MKRVIYLAVWFIFLIAATGCTTYQIQDRSILNHPAMNLSKDWTPAPKGVLTNLNEESNGVNASCSVCAH